MDTNNLNVGEITLRELFKKFSLFGSSQPVDKEGKILMDGSNFVKFCRDMDLLDKKITEADAGIIFATSRREKRKLDYEQFRSALKLLAKKIYPEKIEPEEKFKKLEERILLEGRGPSLSDTTEFVDFERGPLNPLSLEYRGPPIKGKGWKAKPRQSHQIGSGRDSPDTENEFVSESPRQSKTQAETCQQATISTNLKFVKGIITSKRVPESDPRWLRDKSRIFYQKH